MFFILYKLYIVDAGRNGKMLNEYRELLTYYSTGLRSGKRELVGENDNGQKKMFCLVDPMMVKMTLCAEEYCSMDVWHLGI